VVAAAYLLGVSTRRVEHLAAELEVTQLPKSQVSAMAERLDEQVAVVRVDALTQKVRENGRATPAEASPFLMNPVSSKISTPSSSPNCSNTYSRSSSRTRSGSQAARPGRADHACNQPRIYAGLHD
jgi:Transposase, Mutator family